MYLGLHKISQTFKNKGENVVTASSESNKNEEGKEGELDEFIVKKHSDRSEHGTSHGMSVKKTRSGVSDLY
jgi:hypothetical protein